MADETQTSTTPPPGELPPAAVVVTKSPRELELETELASQREATRQAELKAMEAEDKTRQLVEIDSRRPQTVTKPKRERSRFPTIIQQAEYDEEDAAEAQGES